jgi:hypothetical protein
MKEAAYLAKVALSATEASLAADIKEADFFISRSGADADFAAQIGAILEGLGYRVILQQWDFANRSFMDCMQEALESGARVIALLSPAYLKSEHCMRKR